MRRTPPPAARVVWQEGMYLAPHHFQAQRRHFEAELARAIDALAPFAWGVRAAALDPDALATGTLALAYARGRFPDGTPVDAPELDPPPAPVALPDRYSPTGDGHLVHLVLPAWRDDAANVAGDDPSGDDPSGDGAARFRAVTRDVADEATGRDVVPVRFAVKRLRLALDDDLEPGAVALPVARVRRDGAGQFVVDDDYVPPCLSYAASPRLAALLGAMLGVLEAKGAALAATLAAPALTGAAPSAAPSATPAGAPPQAYAGNELATRWLLHAVRSAEAPLRHLAAVRHAHPERLWRELARLAGALCTFSLTAQPGDLPAYAHDDLGGCFGALERHLRAHLDLVVATSAVVVPLRRVSAVLHEAAVTDPRCFAAGARWFLGIGAALPTAELSARVPRLVKACASKYVLELVRRAYPGLGLDFVPAPPPGLAPRPGLAYFELAVAGPCAQGLQDTHALGVYVPDEIPDAALELAVLAP